MMMMMMQQQNKRRMTIAMARNGIAVDYRCINYTTKQGKKCADRDDGSHCMNCRYCRAEMSGRDATRLLNILVREEKEKRGEEEKEKGGN